MKKILIVLAIIVMACTENNQRIAPEPKIGDQYLNGTVFYIFQPSDANFYVEGETHGLIVYNEDLPAVKWGCTTAQPNQMQYGLGWGDYNTNYILSICPNSESVNACRNLGKDWYLPTTAELEEMVKINLKIPGIDINQYYWSSNRTGSYYYAVRLKDGNNGEYNHLTSLPIRPVRRF